MTKVGIEHFPELEDWTEVELDRLGYKRQTVSIFDHWLTAEEWETSPVTSWKVAQLNGQHAEYLAQDRQFLRFYKELFGRGAYRRTGRRLCYGEGHVAWHDGWDRHLKKLAKKAIQDRGRMDVYVPHLGVRVIQGWDKGDILLFEAEADEQCLAALAKQHGLFII